MRDNDLLQLADREIERLTSENDHGAAIIMRALVERLRGSTDAKAFDAGVVNAVKRMKQRGLL
jgi:hypothetical protein